jgi:hypothetical protein
MRWWELDMTYIAIKLMSYVGLAYAIKLPKPSAKSTVHPTGPPRAPLLGAHRSDEGAALVAAETDR